MLKLFRLKRLIYISLLLVVVSACKHEFEHPQWNTQILAPLIKSTLSIEDIIADSLITSNTDSSLKIVYENLLYELEGDTLFKIPDTTVIKIVKLDSIELGNSSISFPISLGNIAQQLQQSSDPGDVFLGTYIISQNGNSMSVPPISNLSSGDIAIDAQNLFKTITLLDGYMDITIENGLPVDITDLIFKLRNLSGADITQDTFPLIVAGTTASKTISLAGKTIEGNLLGTIINMSSPGSYGNPVLIDTSDVLINTITVRDLQPYSATAVFPAQDIVNQIENVPFKLEGVGLTKAKVKSGQIRVEAFSTLQDTVRFHYEIPSAQLNGNAFQLDNIMPPAPVGGVSHFLETYDFNNYDLTLTGINNDTVNTIYNILIGSIDSTGVQKTIALTDSFYFYIGFIDVIPGYAKGYLGQDTIEIGPEEVSVSLFERITGGTLQLEDIKLDFTIENGIGADARIYVDKVISINSKEAISVPLTGTALNNPLNVIRANENFSFSPPVAPSVSKIQLNNSNSNAKSFLENMPDKIEYSFKIYTNPNGNISGGNDFMYDQSNLRASLNMEIPLSFISDKLTLADTVDFSLTSSAEDIKDGIFTLIADNGFPFDATVQLFLLDNANNIIDSLITPNKILAAPVDANLKVVSRKRSKLLIPLDENKMSRLRSTKKIKIVADFTTVPSSQYIKVYSSYMLDLKLIGDFNYFVN